MIPLVSEARTFLTVGELRDQIEVLLNTGQVQMPIESGILKTNGEKRWFPVAFLKRFVTTPSVIAQGTFKTGNVPTYTVEIPSITAPVISLPSITIPPVTVPNVTIPPIPYRVPRLDMRQAITGYDTISEYMAHENRKKFLVDTEQWWWFPAAQIRDAMSWVAFGMGAFIGSFFDWFVSDYIQPHFDNVESTLRGVRNAINDNLIGRGRTPMVGSINRALDDLEGALQGAFDGVIKGTNEGYKVLRDSVQGAFDQVKTEIDTTSSETSRGIENAMNNQIANLYEYLGILDGAPFVPTKVKSVTSIGFELYSTGAPEYHWVAVGV